MTLLVGACVVVMTLLVVAMVVAAAAGAGWAILSRTRTCARAGTHTQAKSWTLESTHAYACVCEWPGTHSRCIGALARTDTSYNYTDARCVM